jgi:3-dehydroquinate synthase
VVCLDCAPDEILRRLNDNRDRPLLSGLNPAARLAHLLETRRPVYESFAWRVDTTGRTVGEVVDTIMDSGRFLIRREQEVRQDWRRFHVETPVAYDICVGRGVLDSLVDLCHERGLQLPGVVVTDANVGPLYAEGLASRLGAQSVTIPAGEAYKTLDTVRRLYDAFLDAGLERGGTIAALAGGVIGDMAGFAAATYLRGVAWIDLPTSLLAIVDASIGGKVGVDLPHGKNLVGAFHMPALVVADLDTLDTLPQAEFRAGMAEVIKAGIIGDVELFARLEKPGFFQTPGFLEEVVSRAIAVKVDVVQTDPYERSGARAKLNLGHTIGHAIEATSGFRYRHGEAIATGLIGEARLAERIGLAERGLADRIEQVVQRIGLPVRYRGLAPNAVRASMQVDKKKQNQQLRFALPKRIGEVVTGIEVDEAVLAEVLKEIMDGN